MLFDSGEDLTFRNFEAGPEEFPIDVSHHDIGNNRSNASNGPSNWNAFDALSLGSGLAHHAPGLSHFPATPENIPEHVRDLLGGLRGDGGTDEVEGTLMTAASGPDIVVTYYVMSDFGFDYGEEGYGYTDHATLYPGGGGGGGYEGPNCANTNNITDTAVPDGAKYYLPEGITADYITGAINHISGIYDNSILNKRAVMNEIKSMYTNPANPHFVDFKDWGTASGPAGSISGGQINYYSAAAGQFVSGSAFEPFGNYFFGLICTFGGLAPEEIYAAAAWFSESGSWWEGDDPQDQPHVDKGISDAQRWLNLSDAQKTESGPLFEIGITQCT